MNLFPKIRGTIANWIPIIQNTDKSYHTMDLFGPGDGDGSLKMRGVDGLKQINWRTNRRTDYAPKRRASMMFTIRNSQRDWNVDGLCRRHRLCSRCVCVVRKAKVRCGSTASYGEARRAFSIDVWTNIIYTSDANEGSYADRRSAFWLVRWMLEWHYWRCVHKAHTGTQCVEE